MEMNEKILGKIFLTIEINDSILEKILLRTEINDKILRESSPKDIKKKS